MKSSSRVSAVAAVAALTGLVVLPGAAEEPLAFYTVSPCRLVDTRLPEQVPGQFGPILTSAVERKFPVQGNCGVPVGARAVAVNITVVSPTNLGNLKLYPAGTTAPLTSNINFDATMFSLANGAIVTLADKAAEPNDLAVTGKIQNDGQVHLVLDVTGYFMP